MGQALRARLSMAAYQHSHLLRYAEEAIAESVAQLGTGGSLRAGLFFPIRQGYVNPVRMLLEAGAVGGAMYGIYEVLR